MSEPAGAEKRYRLLESVRAYALEKPTGDDEMLRRRHAEYYADVADRAQANLPAAESPAQWARSLEPEFENFCATLKWAFGESGDPLVGARVLTALQELWIERGLAMEAARRAQRVLVMHQALPQRLRAALWLTLTRCENEFQMPPQVVLEAATQARELCEPLGDRRALATALRIQGVARVRLGALTEAQSDLQRSLDLFREIGDLREVARALGSLGYLFQNRGDFALARTATLEVLQLTSDIGDDRGSALATMNLAETDFALGEIESAVSRASSNLEHDEVLSKGSGLRATQESNLAAYLVALGRYAEARSMALASIQDSESSYMAIPLQHLTAMLASNHPKRAARLLGYVEKVFAETPFSRQVTEQYTYDFLMSALHQTMEDDEIARLGHEGAAMTEDQILKLARREASHETPNERS
jgi:tetratricopeptide (TPR) repeat protein